MQEELQVELRSIVDRFSRNIARTHNLVNLYRLLSGSGAGRRSVEQADLLRSAVVLLHASLEDFLRSVARIFLPLSDPDVINSVPLVGTSSSGRPEKFFLGRLVEHRGKTVEQLIVESIHAHLDKSSFSNTTEIAGLLRNLRLDVGSVSHTFSTLDEMMARRHQIVHRADCTEESGRGRHHAESLRESSVEAWITAVNHFLHAVVSPLKSTED